MYTHVSRGMLNRLTDGISGLMLATMITSVRQPELSGRLSLPNSTMLIVCGGKSRIGTGVGAPAGPPRNSVPEISSVGDSVTVGRRPGSGGFDVAVGVGVSVGVDVRVGRGVHVYVGVQVGGTSGVGRGVEVSVGGSALVAVASTVSVMLGMICAATGTVGRLTIRPSSNCSPTSTARPRPNVMSTNSRGE